MGGGCVGVHARKKHARAHDGHLTFSKLRAVRASADVSRCVTAHALHEPGNGAGQGSHNFCGRLQNE